MRDGLAASTDKIACIQECALPKSAKELRRFLGLVQYLWKFINKLADYSYFLTQLTKMGIVSLEGLWTKDHQHAFDQIKPVVTSLPCLQPINHNLEEPIFVMIDASNLGVGGVLMQGPPWKTAHPAGFYSRQYLPAEKNHATHEQELLAVVACLKHWWIELLGTLFTVLTDHHTLTLFHTQPELSK